MVFAQERLTTGVCTAEDKDRLVFRRSRGSDRGGASGSTCVDDAIGRSWSG